MLHKGVSCSATGNLSTQVAQAQAQTHSVLEEVSRSAIHNVNAHALQVKAQAHSVLQHVSMGAIRNLHTRAKALSVLREESSSAQAQAQTNSVLEEVSRSAIPNVNAHASQVEAQAHSVLQHVSLCAIRNLHTRAKARSVLREESSSSICNVSTNASQAEAQAQLVLEEASLSAIRKLTTRARAHSVLEEVSWSAIRKMQDKSRAHTVQTEAQKAAQIATRKILRRSHKASERITRQRARDLLGNLTSQVVNRLEARSVVSDISRAAVQNCDKYVQLGFSKSEAQKVLMEVSALATVLFPSVDFQVDEASPKTCARREARDLIRGASSKVAHRLAAQRLLKDVSDSAVRSLERMAKLDLGKSETHEVLTKVSALACLLCPEGQIGTPVQVAQQTARDLIHGASSRAAHRLEAKRLLQDVSKSAVHIVEHMDKHRLAAQHLLHEVSQSAVRCVEEKSKLEFAKEDARELIHGVSSRAVHRLAAQRLLQDVCQSAVRSVEQKNKVDSAQQEAQWLLERASALACFILSTPASSSSTSSSSESDDKAGPGGRRRSRRSIRGDRQTRQEIEKQAAQQTATQLLQSIGWRVTQTLEEDSRIREEAARQARLAAEEEARRQEEAARLSRLALQHAARHATRRLEQQAQHDEARREARLLLIKMNSLACVLFPATDASAGQILVSAMPQPPLQGPSYAIWLRYAELPHLAITSRVHYALIDGFARSLVSSLQLTWPENLPKPVARRSTLHDLILLTALRPFRKQCHVRLAAGRGYSLACTDSGAVNAWGKLPERQMQGPLPQPRPLSEWKNYLPRLRIASVACGDDFYLLLTRDGQVWTDGRERHRIRAWQPQGRDPVIAVAAGKEHGLLLSATGSVWGFGEGAGLIPRSPRPHSLGPALGIERLSLRLPIVAVCCGGSHSLMVDADTLGLWAVGRSAEGQLGIGHAGVVVEKPRLVPRLRGVVAVSAGFWHTVVLCLKKHPVPCTLIEDDMAVDAWGFGRAKEGQLGIGIQVTSAPPLSPRSVLTAQRILGFPTGVSSQLCGVGCGALHTLFCDRSGQVWGCGSGSFGQLGEGEADVEAPPWAPVRVTLQGRITMFSCGAYHNLAMDTSCRVWSWGLSEEGQLGTRANQPHERRFVSTPQLVPGIVPDEEIADEHTH